MNAIDIPSAVEPTEWFVVFHRKSQNRVLSFLAFGERKHVSAFAYCPGHKVWLIYDVQWAGTRILLVDKAAIMAWTKNCDVVKIGRTGARMGISSRAGLYCVNAVKHLVGLVCVAATPDQLYRHILRNGGLSVSESKRAPAASGRPDAAAGAGSGA